MTKIRPRHRMVQLYLLFNPCSGQELSKELDISYGTVRNTVSQLADKITKRRIEGTHKKKLEAKIDFFFDRYEKEYNEIPEDLPQFIEPRAFQLFSEFDIKILKEIWNHDLMKKLKEETADTLFSQDLILLPEGKRVFDEFDDIEKGYILFITMWWRDITAKMLTELRELHDAVEEEGGSEEAYEKLKFLKRGVNKKYWQVIYDVSDDLIEKYNKDSEREEKLERYKKWERERLKEEEPEKYAQIKEAEEYASKIVPSFPKNSEEEDQGEISDYSKREWALVDLNNKFESLVSYIYKDIEKRFSPIKSVLDSETIYGGKNRG